MLNLTKKQVTFIALLFFSILWVFSGDRFSFPKKHSFLSVTRKTKEKVVGVETEEETDLGLKYEAVPKVKTEGKDVLKSEKLTFLELDKVFTPFYRNKNLCYSVTINIDDDGIKNFLNIDKRHDIKHLSIRYKSLPTSDYWNTIFQLKQLKTLSIYNSSGTIIYFDVISVTTKNTSIENVVCNGMTINENLINFLNKLTNVKTISFKNCIFKNFSSLCDAIFMKEITSLQFFLSEITAEDLWGLSKLKKLRILDLRGISKIFVNSDDDQLGYLGILGKRITTLNLDDISADNKDLKIFMSKFTRLEELGFVDNRSLEFDESIVDQNLKTLKVLSVSCSNTFNLKSISKLQQLKYLDISHVKDGRLTYSFENAKNSNVNWGNTLEILVIGHLNLKHKTFEDIITFCPHLKILKLYGNSEIFNPTHEIYLQNKLDKLEMLVLECPSGNEFLELPCSMINSCINLKTLMILCNTAFKIKTPECPKEYNYLFRSSYGIVFIEECCLKTLNFSDSLKTLSIMNINALDISSFKKFIKKTNFKTIRFGNASDIGYLSQELNSLNKNNQEVKAIQELVYLDVQNEYEEIQKRRLPTS